MSDVNIDTHLNGSANYVEVDETSRESLSVQWRAVAVGVVISTFTYLVLMSLGLALGASQVRDLMAGDLDAHVIGTGAGIFLLVSVLISLFVGSYASARVSGIIATRVGYTQGAVIAAIFFTVMISEAGVALGALGSSLSSLGGVIGGAAGQAVQSQRLNAVIEDAVSDLRLKTSPNEVATGMLSRVLRGDSESAINYLSAQSGITRQDAAARFNRVNTQLKTTAGTLARKGADAAQTAGWAAFATLLIGLVGGMVGGALGAQLSIRAPVGAMDRRAMRNARRPAFT